MGHLAGFASKSANFASGQFGVPKTLATSEEDQDQESKRVNRRDLEDVYLTNPQAFNTINKSKQLIMSAGFEIRAQKKGVQSKYDDFFNNIGKIGMRTNTHQLISYIHHDKFLYGNAYVERIYDKDQTEILDLKMIDPKLMDFARDAEGIIVVDNFQNPVGYTMDIGRRDSLFMGDEIPNTNDSPVTGNVVLRGTEIFLLAFRIAHFRMFTFGNRFDAVGVIEPAYEDITRKHKIEDATANSIHNTASFPIIGYVGDNQRAASQKVMDSTLNALQNLSHSRYMVFQHPTKVETLEVKHSEQVGQALKHFRGNEAAASGMALGFSIGDGEALNRSTLAVQQRMLDLTLESEANLTAQEFKVLILDEINRVNRYGSEADLIWGNIAAEEKNDKTGRLMDAISNDVIAPLEARQYMLLSEGIEPNEEAYKKYINSKKAQKTAKESVTAKAAKAVKSSDEKSENPIEPKE